MARLIDADAFKELLIAERDKIPLTTIERYGFGAEVANAHGQSMRGGIRKALRCMEQTPTVDAVEVVHGEWIDRFNNKYDNHILQCSICDKNALYCTITDELGSERNVQVMSEYCPHCGAKMKGTANGG